MRARGIFIWVAAFALWALAFASEAQAAYVTNVDARLVGDKVVFTFDIRGDEDKAVVTVKINGKSGGAVSGDLGEVSVGSGKKITWDVLADHPDGFEGRVRWEIEAEGVEVERPRSYEPEKKSKPSGSGDKKFRPLPSF